MATLRYQVGVPPAAKEVTALIREAASRAGPGSFVISSGYRPTDSDSLHSLKLAGDVSLRQSTGDLDTLYDELLNQSPPPDELFYKNRLYDKGKFFTDAELSADHQDHLHAGWDNPPGAITGVKKEPALSGAGASSDDASGLFSFFFAGNGLLRFAAVALGFGALAIGLIIIFTDQAAQVVTA